MVDRRKAYEDGLTAGITLACALADISKEDFIRKKAKVDTIVQDPSMQDLLVKVAMAKKGSFITTALGKYADLFPYLSTAGALGGASIGALFWALNRDTMQQDLDAEAIKEQAKHYERIARDIKKKLKYADKEERPSMKNLEESVADQGEGAYII